MHPTFDHFTAQATGGHGPYTYQSRLAEQGLPDVLAVPTGAGKTLAAVLPWLYRRVSHPDPAVRAATPRWLVFVLPQRTLVEQTVAVVEGWLANLGLDVPVHLLMGGEDPSSREWQARPARERIFVGTQDMVLSRLLMRGFAEFRSIWPMSFGLLHAGGAVRVRRGAADGAGATDLAAAAGSAGGARHRAAVPLDVDVRHPRAHRFVHRGLPAGAVRGRAFLATSPAPAHSESGAIAIADPRAGSALTAMPGLPWGRQVMIRPIPGAHAAVPGWLTCSVVPVEAGQYAVVAVARSVR